MVFTNYLWPIYLPIEFNIKFKELSELVGKYLAYNKIDKDCLHTLNIFIYLYLYVEGKYKVLFNFDNEHK